MRRFLFLLIFVLMFCFASTSEARKLALLVGVDEYRNVTSLKCCVNDMNTLKEALKKIGFAEGNIKVLTTGSASVQKFPSKENIEQNIAEILSTAGPSDVVFFAFSGHGMREDEADYFCPPYADPENIKGTCVSITKVMKDLARSNASLKWMVVDACRNTPTNSRDSRSFQVIPKAPEGIVLFQSCEKGQKSYEEERAGGNGYFTKNLAAALSGKADKDHDGKLTLLEVCDWTTDQTEAEVRKAENKTQRPYLKGELSKIVLKENLNIPKAKKLAAEAQKAMDAKNYALAIEKYDAALALWEFEYWKRERDLAKQFLEQEKRIKEAEKKAREAAITGTTLPASSKPVTAGTTRPASSRKAGERKVFKVDGIEYAFRWCPPGEFMMGSPSSEEDRDYDETRHRVKLTRGFWLLETEVTQEMWQSVMGESIESKAKQGTWGHGLYGTGPNFPMCYVSWEDCQSFCRKLSQKLGQQVKLATEAQWEYACRAGTTGDYAGNLDEMAWYWDNSGSTTHAVGQKKPNAWGLYDMHGNVWELCSDWYDENYYSKSPTSDPGSTTASPLRVVRGGGWVSPAGYCRSAARGRLDPGSRSSALGLRPVVVPEE